MIDRDKRLKFLRMTLSEIPESIQNESAILELQYKRTPGSYGPGMRVHVMSITSADLLILLDAYDKLIGDQTAVNPER